MSDEPLRMHPFESVIIRTLEADIARLTAEVERLRAALENIRVRRYQNRETIDPGNALEAFIRLNKEIVSIFDEARAALSPPAQEKTDA